ncbi:transcription elongation factor spt5-like [Malania oleifera]|uniref:transcription elongation factor spt5-like n=1 Tax=Malania oleifera TaxID=397392 RepID=UPI0025AEAA7B|nr:transcription elongation factor spt5-like [Malania oleifera]
MSSSVSEIQNTATEIEIPETKSPESEAPAEASSPLSNKRISEEFGPKASDQSKKGSDGEGKDNDDDEEEEEGECGFCLFMKGGGCRESFIAWEKCVEDAEKNKEDIVDKCFEVTGLLKKCMEQHSDYYHPILQAEKVAEEEAVKELEREKALEQGDAPASTDREVEAEAALKSSGKKEASVDKMSG